MKNLLLFKQELESSLKLEQINQALINFLRKKEITTFAFTYHYSHSIRNQLQIKYEQTSPNFKIWHQHYHQQEYANIDTTASTARQSHLPIYWEIEQQIKEANTKREYQMRIDAKKFGATKGVCIPIHGVNNEYAEFLVVQMNDEKCLEPFNSLQYELLSAGHIYYHHIRQHLISTVSDDQNLLNARQIQCLSLLKGGADIKHIAKAMQITERTVNYHIQNINKNLGVKNKYLAISKAEELGVL